MDVVSFYPDITLRLQKRAIGWARQYITITDDDKKLFTHCRGTFAFYEGRPCAKKVNPDFDVPMGSLDGAEICELTGLYLLKQLIQGDAGLT